MNPHCAFRPVYFIIYVIIILFFDYYLTATKLHLLFGLCDKHCKNIQKLKLLIQLKFHRINFANFDALQHLRIL